MIPAILHRLDELVAPIFDRRSARPAAKGGELSVGVIGAGEFVSKLHLPVLETIAGVRPAWVADVERRRAKEVAEAFGLTAIDLGGTGIELPPADIVLVASPYGVRQRHYEALRGRGCALYVEKPFARTVDEHRRICSWFGDAHVAAGFQRRWLGPVQLARELIASGAFGPVRTARFSWGGPRLTTGGRYYSDLRLAGGGPLLETGVHGVDAVLFCTAAEAADVTSADMMTEQGFDVHTKAEVAVRSSHGWRYSAEFVVSYLAETSNKVEFVFDQCRLWLNLFGGSDLYLRTDKDGRDHVISPRAGEFYPLTNWEAAVKHWNTFLGDRAENVAGVASAADTLLTTSVIEQIYRRGLGSSWGVEPC